MNRPRLRFGTGVALSLGVALLAVALLQRHERQVDWTRDHRNTLSRTTRTLLASYPNEIRATVFVSAAVDASVRDDLRGRLEGFRRACPRFTYRWVDPVGQPTVAAAFEVRTEGTIVLESGELRETLSGMSEADLAAALVRLARRGDARIVFLSGHREHRLADTSRDGYSQLATALRRTGVAVSERQLGQLVEDDAEAPVVLVLAGPRDDLGEVEVRRLRHHRAQGGALLVMLDPRELPALESLLSDWGVAPSGGVVLDPSARLYGTDATVPVVSEYGRHPITDRLTRGGVVPTFFPVARGLGRTGSEPGSAPAPTAASPAVSIIARTGERAWEETDDLGGGDTQPVRDPHERSGPIPIVMAATDPALGARLVVVGDSDFVTNGNLELSGNRMLAEGILEWLIASDADLPVFVARETRPFVLTDRDFTWRVTAPALALPVFFSLVGLVASRRGRGG